MFFSHLYLTIYFLSVKTHTHVSHFCFCLSFLLAANWQRSNKMWKLKIALCWCSSMWKILRATTSLMCGIHKKAAVSAAKQTAVLLQRTFGAAAFQSGFHLL